MERQSSTDATESLADEGSPKGRRAGRKAEIKKEAAMTSPDTKTETTLTSEVTMTLPTTDTSECTADVQLPQENLVSTPELSTVADTYAQMETLRQALTTDTETQTTKSESTGTDGTKEQIKTTESETQTEGTETSPIPFEFRPKQAKPQGERAGGVVTVRLKDVPVIRCRFTRDDTLEDLIDALRRRGQLFRADDIILRGRSLIRRMPHLLEECGVRDGDELEVIEKKMPRKVKIRIESQEKEFQVLVCRGENCWARIRPMLALPQEISYNVLLQERLYYRRDKRWRTAVIDYSREETTYYDEVDGEEAFISHKVHYVYDFLSPTEGLRAAPRGTPYLTVYDDPEVLGWDDDRVIFMDSSALFDPHYIVCLLAVYSDSNVGPVLYLRMEGDHYLECVSGIKFRSLSKLLAHHREEGFTPRVTCLLLRENGLIPQWYNPTSRNFLVLRRDGVVLQIKKGRIFSATPRSYVVGTSCWTMPEEDSEFDVDFNRRILRHVNRKHPNAMKG